MERRFRAVHEEQPGEKWRQLFELHWPAYKAWFLSEGTQARPTYLASSSALQNTMPELMPLYEKLVALAGGGDLAARFLSNYCPAPYIRGCSQLVVPHPPRLIRNYDYSAQLSESTWLSTNWLQPVIAMSDCAWGALDGMNASGVAVSLAFGGRREIGVGFGIPLLLRYILEISANTADAEKIARRVPVHMSYNLTVVDAQGEYFTAHLAPDRAPEFTQDRCATNHQRAVEWPEHAALTATVERKAALATVPPDSNLVASFLAPPLYLATWEQGWGTLYTADYHPREKSAELAWPDEIWRATFENFPERG